MVFVEGARRTAAPRKHEEERRRRRSSTFFYLHLMIAPPASICSSPAITRTPLRLSDDSGCIFS